MSARPFLILKGSIPAGARWITVHPGGDKEAKGIPVLIQETAAGSGVHRVIGGAGGKLNYLRLKGVKDAGAYKEQAAQRAKERREAKKLQAKRDKELGVDKAKAQAKRNVREQLEEHAQKFVSEVADKMGWKDEDLRFPEEKFESVSVKARNKAHEEHQRNLVRKAKEAVEKQRQRLLHDAAARAEAIGEVPLENPDPEKLSVQDLDPIESARSGLGFSTDYLKRAEAKGATEEEIRREAEQIKESERPEEMKEAIEKRKQTVRAIGEELKGIQESPAKLEAQLIDPKQAADLLKAEKAYKLYEKQAREASKEIEEGKDVKGAYLLQVGKEDVDQGMMEDLENDLKTIQTRAFLSEVGKQGGEDAMGRHIGVGAYNAINALSLTATGQGLMDRDVVDVLGVAGAAQALSRRLHADLTDDERNDLIESLQEYHVERYMDQSQEAIRRSIELQKAAEEIDISEAVNTDDLVRVQELNAKRFEAVDEARRILGTSLGEFETNAALIVALKQEPKADYTMPLGNLSADAAVARARAIGLQRGDYTIERAGNERILTVHASGMERLTKPVNREDMQALRDSLDIIEGRHDEDNWLPEGVARRPDLAMDIPAGSAPRMAEPFEPGENIEQSIRDYIGGRTADGDAPADIVADLLSADLIEKAPDHDAYMASINKLIPLRDANGKQIPVERHQEGFEAMADEFVRGRYGGDRAPLHRQHVDIDQKTIDALHRSLAEEPAGVAAFKPIGEMSLQDRRALRDVFSREIAKDTGETKTLRAELDELEGQEPEKETEGMFGPQVNPAWHDWKQRRDEKAEELNAAKLDWPKYVKVMGGPKKAYSAIQDVVRSKVLKVFHEQHNRLHPDKPLKLGHTVVRNNLNHLDAIDPEAREQRLSEQRKLQDRLRERVAGKYAAGGVKEKIEQAREAKKGLEQSQMGFFSTEPEPEKERPLRADERYTLGQSVERQIAGVMNTVGKNFQPGEPLKLWQPSMNGKFVAQQRAIKYLDRNKKAVLAAGVGSGKTLIGLGGFTHLLKQGKVKRGLFVVPSIVQGQFAGEALRYLEPGKYQWHAQPGASREERIAGYRNPDNHFSVVTSQAFRDDMISMGAEHAGISESDMAERIEAMNPSERRTWAKETMDKAGLDHDYMMIDEFHDTLSRKGKADSRMANVLNSVFQNSKYGMLSSADPVKNDPSEIWSALNQVDPDRYQDREAFLRRYGVDAVAAKQELRREMARRIFPSRVDAGVKSTRKVETVPLSEGQNKALAHLDEALSKARIARMSGSVDVDSAKHLWPDAFRGVDEASHIELAKNLLENMPLVRDQAVNRIINTHPESAKVDRVSSLAGERRGKPGIVFAHNHAAVDQIADRLRKEGHRVVTITGKDSTKEKAEKRLKFRPESGEPEADILVASDAASVGLNAQRGQWLVQYDTPDTGMRHAQRNGRIERLGQKNHVELIDLVADHPVERKARKRLEQKYQLREIMTDPMDGLDDTGLAGYLSRVQQQRKEGDIFA